MVNTAVNATASQPPQIRKLTQAFISEPSRIPEQNAFQAGGRCVRVLSRLTSPEIIVFADVLSDEECQGLIERFRRRLTRSQVIDPQSGDFVAIAGRTSLGAHCTGEVDGLLERIDFRLAELLCWPRDHSEGLQILCYPPHAEYKPHFDYFPRANPGSAPQMKNGGQRIGSLVMYLNDVEEGGETVFPEVGLAVVPRRGHAVYFSYCNSWGQVDSRTLHGGAPVRSGEKWIATKWLRQHRRV